MTALIIEIRVSFLELTELCITYTSAIIAVLFPIFVLFLAHFFLRRIHQRRRLSLSRWTCRLISFDLYLIKKVQLHNYIFVESVVCDQFLISLRTDAFSFLLFDVFAPILMQGLVLKLLQLLDLRVALLHMTPYFQLQKLVYVHS